MEFYRKTVDFLQGPVFEGSALLLTRLSLAGVFWRSYKTKVVDGTWFEINDIQPMLFTQEFGIPQDWVGFVLPLTVLFEFAFPILLALGLATRFAAFALLMMTLVIELFIIDGAWWAQHSLWAALAMILISRGGGIFSLDAAIHKMRK